MEWKLSKIVLWLLVTGMLSSCLVDIPITQDWEPSEYETETVISSSNHLGFPDLFKYDGVWYVAYRESDNHIKGTFNIIKILKSNDFVNWTEINSFEIPDTDLRDPKFSYNNVTDQLYLHIHKVKDARSNIYVEFDKDVGQFKDITNGSDLLSVNSNVKEWLWSPVWHNNKLYVAGYVHGVRFYRYNDIKERPIVFSEVQNGGGSEIVIRFYNNNLYALARKRPKAMIGKYIYSLDSLSSISYNTSNNDLMWEDLDIEELGGPNMVIHDSIIYLGGRVEFQTKIYKYSLRDKSLRLMETLPSHGDNAYPGFVLIDNNLYGVYYTSSRDFSGFEIRSFIIDINKY